MEQTFLERIRSIYAEAKEFIKQKLEENGGNIIFLMEDEDGEYDTELMLECPSASNVVKHGFYVEYSIVELKLVDGEVKMKLIERGELSSEEEVGLEYANSVAHIADTIIETIS